MHLVLILLYSFHPPVILVLPTGILKQCGKDTLLLTESAHWDNSVSKFDVRLCVVGVSLPLFAFYKTFYYSHLQRSKVKSINCK